MVGVGFSAPFLVEGVVGSRAWAANVELAGLGLNCSGFVSRRRTAGARGSSSGMQQSSWRGAEAVTEPNQTVPMLGPTAVLLPCTGSPRGLGAELTVQISGPAASFASPFVSSSLCDKAVGILPVVLTGF